MRRRRASTFALCAAWTLLVPAQTLNPSPRDLVKISRTLTAAEIQAVLAGTRAALDGRVMHFAYSPDGPGPDMLMRGDGRPRYLQVARRFHYYTGAPARSCDGRTLNGEFVLEYENTGSSWKVTARTHSPIEVNGAAVELLAGTRPLTDAGRKQIGDHHVRGLAAAFKLPEGSIGGPPEGTIDTLWIDVDSLLPVRWALTLPAAARADLPPQFEYGISFTYPTGITLQPPEGVTAPDCVR